MGPKATRPDLLGRVEVLGVPDADVEIAAGLSRGFLSDARRGRLATARADEAWGRLEAWLGTQDGGASGAAGTGEGGPDERVASLFAGLRQANTCEEHDELAKLAVELAAEGLLNKSALDALKERRQSLRERIEERRAIDARKPVVVKVLWSSDWRRKVAANEAAAAAENASLGEDDTAE